MPFYSISLRHSISFAWLLRFTKQHSFAQVAAKNVSMNADRNVRKNAWFTQKLQFGRNALAEIKRKTVVVAHKLSAMKIITCAIAVFFVARLIISIETRYSYYYGFCQKNVGAVCYRISIIISVVKPRSGKLLSLWLLQTNGIGAIENARINPSHLPDAAQEAYTVRILI